MAENRENRKIHKLLAMKTTYTYLLTALMIIVAAGSAQAQSTKLDSLKRVSDAVTAQQSAVVEEYDKKTSEFQYCKTDEERLVVLAQREEIEKRWVKINEKLKRVEREIYIENARIAQVELEEQLTNRRNIKQGGNTEAYRGVLNGHEWVDLGLPSGTKWATCNVGAESRGQVGVRVAWAEVKQKRSWAEYTWKGYACARGEMYDIAGNAKMDAATANWGEGWRMPTREEWEELREYCSWDFVMWDGIEGSLFVSDINANYIFIPCAGYTRDDSGKLIYTQYNGAYWASTPIGNDGAYALIFNYELNYVSTGMRCSAHSIRAVCGAPDVVHKAAAVAQSASQTIAAVKGATESSAEANKSTTEANNGANASDGNRGTNGGNKSASETSANGLKSANDALNALKDTAEAADGAVKAFKSLKSLFGR